MELQPAAADVHAIDHDRELGTQPAKQQRSAAHRPSAEPQRQDLLAIRSPRPQLGHQQRLQRAVSFSRTTYATPAWRIKVSTIAITPGKPKNQLLVRPGLVEKAHLGTTGGWRQCPGSGPKAAQDSA